MGNVCWQHKCNRGIRMPKQVSLGPPKDSVQIQGLDAEDTGTEAKALSLPSSIWTPFCCYFTTPSQLLLLHSKNKTTTR